MFQYTPEIGAHWGVQASFAAYNVAAFARDMLSAAGASLAPLPALVERLAADWSNLAALDRLPRDHQEVESYAGLRWLAERSPWTSYLVEHPRVSFVRVSNEIRVHWENDNRQIDGIPVWTATRGVFALSIEAFTEECRSFHDRLLRAMAARIDRIEAGRAKPLAEVDVSSLRQQHDTWQRELSDYTDRPYQPDVAWEDAESALRKLFPSFTPRGVPP
ncbi:MAG: hypothetical protein KF764_05670 [Labilithrix sp.]|nr:hypothetical protein [Labilithrix sp.]